MRTALSTKVYQIQGFFPMVKRQIVVSVGAAILPAALSVPAFASGSSSTPGAGDVAVVDGVAANLAVIIPIGIALFAILLGVTLIPKVIKKFLS